MGGVFDAYRESVDGYDRLGVTGTVTGRRRRRPLIPRSWRGPILLGLLAISLIIGSWLALVARELGWV
jgi:hypothetical protein